MGTVHLGLHHHIETWFENVYIYPLSALLFRQWILTPAKPLVACQYSFARRYPLS